MQLYYLVRCFHIVTTLFILLFMNQQLTRAQSILDIFRNRNIVGQNIVDKPSREPYDFIIVGAGSGGSVLANRLSENSEWRVLLLEAGGTESLFNQVPMLVSLFQTMEYNNWGYKVEPQSRACLGMKNQQCPCPTAKSLGGTSTINYMIHTRGSHEDYDNWFKLGNEGWSFKDLLPYFKKSENFDIPGINNSIYHNENGYLSVQHALYHTKLSTAFLEAGKCLNYETVDYNGEKQIGFSYLQLNMNKGRRCSAATAYLAIHRPNLHILTDARVIKVLIINKRVHGVIYIRNDKKYVVRASKEVILSSGTINSAQILMLSGIGPKEHLEKLGIDVVQDSKVGFNMYEHIGFLGLTFMVNQSLSLLQNRVLSPTTIPKYAFGNSGLSSIAGGAEAIAFIRTENASDTRPNLELLFISGSLHSDGGTNLKKSLGLTDEIYDTVFKPIENKDAWSIWPIVQNPQSVGRVTLRSKNPLDAPVIQPNFFENLTDLEILLEGVKQAIKISKTKPFVTYGSRLHDIKISGCRDLEFASDDYWRCAIRYLPAMMNHEIGTVKMGPNNDSSAVVDPQLRVYGVIGLRVADASIMPTITTGHTNAVVYMIGEKAADMIKDTWMDKEEFSRFTN